MTAMRWILLLLSWVALQGDTGDAEQAPCTQRFFKIRDRYQNEMSDCSSLGGRRGYTLETCKTQACSRGANVFNWRNGLCFYKKCEAGDLRLVKGSIHGGWDVYAYEAYYTARGRGHCDVNATVAATGSILMAAEDCRALQGSYQGDPQGSEVINCYFDWCNVMTVPTTLHGLGPARSGRCSPKPYRRGALRAYKIHCDAMGGYPQEGAQTADWAWVTCWMDWCEITNANRDILVASASDSCAEEGEKLGSAVVYFKAGDCRDMGGKPLGQAKNDSWTGCVFTWCRAGKDCKRTQQGREYNGTLATTIGGRPCQRWGSRIPHDHGFNNPSSFPEGSLAEAANYCRNPEGWVEGPFCLTTDPQVPWELCDLPFCSGHIERAPTFQLGTTRYHFVSGVHTDPEAYCNQEFRGHIATFDTLMQVRKVSRKLRWIASAGKISEPSHVWIGGKTALRDVTRIMDLRDIEENESELATTCVVLQKAGEYELFAKTCANLYFPFLCEVFSIRIDNYAMAGAERKEGIIDERSCIRACITPCVAVNFNENDNSCWHHTDKTGCTLGRRTPGVIHVSLKDCECNTFLVSGPSGVEDSAFSASSSSESYVPYGDTVIAHSHSAAKARLNSKNELDADTNDDMDDVGWVAAHNDTNPYLQVQFEHLREIYGIMTKGSTGFNETRQPYWITQFKVNISEDCATWWTIPKIKSSNPWIFDGNIDTQTTVTNLMQRTFHAKCVRILPVTWHKRPALQLEILGCTGNHKNWALGKPVLQSSACPSCGGEAWRAVDGLASTQFNAPWQSCSHTREDQRDPWWTVDLQTTLSVEQVVITNRGDCCGSRLHDLLIRVGKIFSGKSSGDARNFHVCGILRRVAQGATSALNCEPKPIGRFVHLQILGPRETLSLCEVKVHGVQVANETNVALHKVAYQSSNMHLANAGHAVDGQTSSDHAEKSCSHTNVQSDPWWLVDLGEEYTISHVIITNRGDCCAGRLHDFIIGVGNYFVPASGNSMFEVCTHVPGPMALAETRQIDCDVPVSGRYVKILVPGQEQVLTLCEVQVYGNKVQVETFDGNDSPRSCVLPFYYNNTLYKSCISTNGSKPWCSTTEDYDMDGLWGYCMDIRLVDGRSNGEGRVEMKAGGVFGTVCDDGWDDTDAAIVCKQLGYQDGRAIYPPVFKREKQSPIYYRHFNCNGTERALIDCDHATDADKHCVHAEDAGVQCWEGDPVLDLVGYPAIYRSEHDHWKNTIVLFLSSSAVYVMGVLTSWSIYVAGSPKHIHLQVWRPTNDPEVFVLVDQSAIVTSVKGIMHIQLGIPIPVRPGDVLGLSFQGGNPIPFDNSYNCDQHRISWAERVDAQRGSFVKFSGIGAEKQHCRVYSMYASVIRSDTLDMPDFTFDRSVYRFLSSTNDTDSDLAKGLCHLELGQNATLVRVSSIDELLEIIKHLTAINFVGEIWTGERTTALSIDPNLVDWGHCQPEPGKECLTLKRNHEQEIFLWFSKECDKTLTNILCERNDSITWGIAVATEDPMKKWGFIDSEEDEDRYKESNPSESGKKDGLLMGPYIGIIILVIMIILIIVIVVVTYKCQRRRGSSKNYPAFKYHKGAPVSTSEPDNVSAGLENPMYGLTDEQTTHQTDNQANHQPDQQPSSNKKSTSKEMLTE